MTEQEKINILESAVIILSRRLLRLETSEKWRGIMREMIINISSEEIYELPQEPKK